MTKPFELCEIQLTHAILENIDYQKRSHSILNENTPLTQTQDQVLHDAVSLIKRSFQPQEDEIDDDQED